MSSEQRQKRERKVPASRGAAGERGAEPAEAPEDVVLVHGRTADGKGLAVLRKKADAIALGEMRPVEEGKPIAGELVSLRPREGAPLLFDVDVLHAADAPRKGPAQVASASYRTGWQTVFGGTKARPARASQAAKKSLN